MLPAKISKYRYNGLYDLPALNPKEIEIEAWESRE
jgi:hypothetical protein